MIIVDTETGGLDPARCALLAVAAVHMETGETFFHYVRPFPTFACEAEAERVHGLTREFLEGQGLDEEDVMRRFAAWLHLHGRQDWAGCNPSFDQRFLDAAFERSGLETRMGRRPVCLQTVAWMADRLGAICLPVGKDGGRLRSLDAIAKTLGLGRQAVTHDALEDARLTLACLRRLLGMLRPNFPMKQTSDFCSRREDPAGNGGEKKSAAGCPGSPGAAAVVTAGAGCKFFESPAGTEYEWDGLDLWRIYNGVRKHVDGVTAADLEALVEGMGWTQVARGEALTQEVAP